MCNIVNENDFKINKNVFDHCNLSSSHFREHTCDQSISNKMQLFSNSSLLNRRYLFIYFNFFGVFQANGKLASARLNNAKQKTLE